MDELIRNLLINILPFPWNSKRPIFEYPASFEIYFDSNTVFLYMQDSGPTDPCDAPPCDPTNFVWTETFLTLTYVCSCDHSGSINLYDDPSYLYVDLTFKINGKYVTYHATLITNNWLFLRRIEGWNLNLCDCYGDPPSNDVLRRFCSDGQIENGLFSPALIYSTINSFTLAQTGNISVFGNINDFDLFDPTFENGACEPLSNCDDGTITVSLFSDNKLVSSYTDEAVSPEAVYAFSTTDESLNTLGLPSSLIHSFKEVRNYNGGNLRAIEITLNDYYPCGYNLMIKAENCPGLCSSGSGWYLRPGTYISGFNSFTRIAPPGSVSTITLAILVAAMVGGKAILKSDGSTSLIRNGIETILSFIECTGPFDFVNEEYL